MATAEAMESPEAAGRGVRPATPATPATSPIRRRSPPTTPPPYGDGLDGSAGAGNPAGVRKYVDYKMEAAPSWDGERPEQMYREYARNLRLWLIEAEERLPQQLIGKRIIDSIPYGSRLSALVGHLSVEEITAADGYKQVIQCIEEAHEYLKVAKLEQAFSAAIFGGRRKAGQTITGFLATKRASFSELKKQGLDLLSTDAGQHLLGHLVMRQGGFSNDEQQRIRVLTDGSIDFRKVEPAIRKIFGDAVDDPPGPGGPRHRTFWEGEEEDDYEQDGYDMEVFYGDFPVEADEDIFQDLLEEDEAGDVFMCLDAPLPSMMDEDQAVQYAGELLTYIYGETADRWQRKGKGKGKSKSKSKGKGKGKDKNSAGKGFGVYGAGNALTYPEHRRALQTARMDRGYSRPPSFPSPGRPRTSLQDIKARTRCHQCKQLGHWSRECPQRQTSRPRSPVPQASGTPAGTPRVSANHFFLNDPVQLENGVSEICFQGSRDGPPMFTGFIEAEPALDDVSPDGPGQLVRPDLPSMFEEYMSGAFLNYTFATCHEPGGCALIDTAAQHGLIGAQTLEAHDRFLQNNFRLRIQVTDEVGGTVKGVCGSEQVTKVAYIAIGVGGKPGVLRVQVVPGVIPCLVPAYLLTDAGAIIDMPGSRVCYTHVGALQNMTRRSSGHMEVNMCEFGESWKIPANYGFIKSEIWGEPFVPTKLSLAVFDGAGKAAAIPSAMAALCAAVFLCLGQPGEWSPRANYLSASAPACEEAGCQTRGAGGQSIATTSRRAKPVSSGPGGTSSSASYSGRGGTRGAAEASGGAPRQVKVPFPGAEIVSDLCSPEYHPRCERGLVLDQVHTLCHGRADPQDAAGPDVYLEQRADLPGPGLPDSWREEEGDGGEARSTPEPRFRGAWPAEDARDELDGATCESPRAASRTFSSGDWDADVSGSWFPRRRDGAGKRAFRGRVESVGQGGQDGTWAASGSSVVDASVSSLPVWGTPLDVVSGGGPSDLALQRRTAGMPVPVARLQQPCGLGNGDQVMCDVPPRESEEDCASRSGSLPMPSVPGLHAAVGVGTGVPGVAEQGRLQPGADARLAEHINNREGFCFLGWMSDTEMMEKMAAVCKLVPSIDLGSAAVFSFSGTVVPSQVPVRCRCPLGPRIIAAPSGAGQWNLLQIDRTGNDEYDLAVPSSVFVIQSFEDDFLKYAKDQEFEPIEVALDKSIKKKLNGSLDKVLKNVEQYFEMWEEECSGEPDDSEVLEVSVAIPGTSSVQPVPLDPSRAVEVEIDHDDLCAQQRVRCLPMDLEMTSLCNDLRDFAVSGEAWRDFHGQSMLLSLHPRQALLPQAGPAGRTLRWTAVMVQPGTWKWIENGACGAWHRDARKHLAVAVIYRWPEVMENYATSFDLSDREKSDILRCHVNLGHPGTREFVRLLRAAGSRNDVIQYVLREFQCPGCVKERRPPTRLPAATPRTYDFNVIVGVDLLFVHVGSRAEHPVLNITCLGTLYSTFGVIDPLQRSAHVTWKAFARLWLRVFGAPQYLVFDEGREFTASTFQDGLDRHGIIPLEVARNAPFTNGVVERRGGLFKEVYYRTRELVQPTSFEEVEIMVFEVSWSLQTLVNRSGYSPAQRVLGRQPSLALDTLADQREYLKDRGAC